MGVLMSKLAHHLNEGAIFVDVGVNTGQTLIKARSYLPKLRYVGFEPNPACVAYVDELIAANAWLNVSVFPIGIGAESRVAELHFYANGITDSSASVIENFRPKEPVHKKAHIALFPMLAEYIGGQAAMVKIDVEGAELEVILGSSNIIKRDRPFVFMELLPAYDSSREDRLQNQTAIETYFSEINYQCMRIIKKVDSSELSGLESIDTIGIHSDMKLCDYLWCPIEKVDVLTELIL